MCFGKETGVSGGDHWPPAHDLSAAQPCQVETYSGYRLHERPRRFTWQGRWLEVRRVLRRWQEPDNLSFIVVAADSRQFLLRYRRHQDAWEVLALARL